MRGGQHLQGVGRREQHVVGPGMFDCGNEPLQVEVSDGLLERLRCAAAGNGLGRPVDADAEAALGQPVGVGLGVGLVRFTAAESPNSERSCRRCGRSDEFSSVHGSRRFVVD